jgi:hypothetical protein
LPPTLLAVPALHKFVVGAVLTVNPFDVPHVPLTAAAFNGAVQFAVAPPLVPAQLHAHGPAPPTLLAVPALHKFVVGAVLTLTPFDVPHVPLTAAAFNEAVQFAVAPPLVPTQLHAHGPVPPTLLAAPTLHKFVVGAVLRVNPFDAPHVPFTAFDMSELLTIHHAFIPSPLPVHVHDVL